MLENEFVLELMWIVTFILDEKKKKTRDDT